MEEHRCSDDNESRSETRNISAESQTVKRKSKKFMEHGLIYLSKIPPYMTVKAIREYFSKFGELGRIYLQPRESEPGKKSKRKCNSKYTDGWIEFKNKRLAKRVALTVNNQPVGGKKRARYGDVLWNIRYLSKFKWTHLSELTAYQKATHCQRMRQEISQAKRETSAFIGNVEKSKMLKSISERRSDFVPNKFRNIKQRPTREEHESIGADSRETDSLLFKIFNKSTG